MIIIALCLKVPDQDTTKIALIKKLSQLDVIGNAFLMPGVVCLLLAPQWGGQIYAWNNGRVVALLVITAVFLLAFVAVQILLPKTATIPPRIAKQRSIIAGFLATIFLGSSQYIYIYFLPIWFQAINGASAVDSGIRLLPLMLAMVLASIFGGLVVQKTGYYTPAAIVGSSIMCVGAGLLITLQVDTGKGKWIGYQILYGFGMGMCSQAPNLAAQTVLPTEDVSIGIALMFFATLLGAAVFVSVGQNVLDNQLVQRFSSFPGFEPGLITEGGATSFLSSLPANLQETGLIEYNEALRRVFQIGLLLSSMRKLVWRASCINIIHSCQSRCLKLTSPCEIK
ncbi:hypothetical protein EYC80_003299 [Monilinia laxa]|uniref:Major facilitator superfamily (MFS) profile domain-containing protein n=1 Tax=Monilinia laxa TaxID=61186 RepID=A0A5N6KEL5_MONLA|nr:hypothetical protein EYC80_003299 [Monilinia laxa]